ncbi:MAG: hypothetical protein HY263_05325 [Chloroflexi bacterium]|nr:hypothetical protein [Chloroflexota bacterium]
MNRDVMERWVRPVIAGLALLVTLLLVIGAAIRDPQPHGIPVGLAGPPDATAPIVQAFGQNAPGAFAFTSYASEAEARSAIDDRTIVAALVLGQAGPRLVVAGAAGDAIAGGVTTALTGAFKAQGVDLAVETVHPFPAGDAHGIVLFFLVLATALSAVAAGAAAGLGSPRRAWAQTVAAVSAFAVAAGVVGVGLAAWLGGGYGDGTWPAMVLGGLLALAVGLTVAASARWLGIGGVALAAGVVVLLGLVSSGGPLGSTFLPDAYRAVAPWLPVEPAYSAMRGAIGFNGAGVAAGVTILAGWAAVGFLGLVAAAAIPGRTTKTESEQKREAAAPPVPAA